MNEELIFMSKDMREGRGPSQKIVAISASLVL